MYKVIKASALSLKPRRWDKPYNADKICSTVYILSPLQLKIVPLFDASYKLSIFALISCLFNLNRIPLFSDGTIFNFV